MSNPRQGVLIYDEESGRFDIRFSLEEYYGRGKIRGGFLDQSGTPLLYCADRVYLL